MKFFTGINGQLLAVNPQHVLAVTTSIEAAQVTSIDIVIPGGVINLCPEVTTFKEVVTCLEED